MLAHSQCAVAEVEAEAEESIEVNIAASIERTKLHKRAAEKKRGSSVVVVLMCWNRRDFRKVML